MFGSVTFYIGSLYVIRFSCPNLTTKRHFSKNQHKDTIIFRDKQIMFWFCKWNELILRCFLRLPPHFRLNRNIYLPMSKKCCILYFLLSEQFFFYLIHFGRTRTLFILFFLFPPFNKVFASLTAVLIIFVGWAVHFRYAVWQKRCLPFLAYLYYPRETFRITLASLHCPLFRMPPGCPVPEDVCGDAAFAEVCSPCARGCLHRDPAIRTDARVSFVLLLCPCAVWVSFCPAPTHTPVHVHRPACFVLPLLEVCTIPIYL